MENNPLVSVIMNCYNSDEFLKEAIESVLNQTYKNFEIIFWDNQSTDNSATIVKSYDDERIKYFYAPKFTPLGSARNLAIKKCSGEWIGFLDCDDIWDKEKLELSFVELNKNKNNTKVSLIYSKSYIIDKENNITSKSSRVESGCIHNILLKDGDFIIFSSIIVKKDILSNNGKINEALNYCEDYELLLKVTKNYEAIGIDEYLTSYRMHENNITSTKIYENNMEVVEMLNSYIKENNISFLLKLNIFFNNSYRIGTTFIKLLLKKEFQNSFEILKHKFLYLLLFPTSIIKVKVFNEN
jgi:glycosyltransferase involved in cell wall biosynthesis